MATSQTAWFGPVTHDLGLLATVLERYDEAEEHFAVAVEVQDRMGAQGMVVHTRLAWARMLLRRAGTNDASKARTLLEEAKVGAREVKIPAIEARIDELLAHLPT
jgi:sugar phosphate isomerase/epimerase